MPVRILRLIARLNVGGPAIHVSELSARLDAERYQQILACGVERADEGSMHDYALERGVRPLVLPELTGDASIGPSDLKAFRRVLRLVREYRPHIVHTHTGKAGILGRLAARTTGTPVTVHTYHGHVLDDYYGPLKTHAARQLERMLARLSTRLVAVSEKVKVDLVRHGVDGGGKIEVISLGFDLKPFATAERFRGEFRDELGLHQEHQLVGIVGRIFPIKNHRLFLNAAARVAARNPAVHFVVVGEGVLSEQTRDLARELGLEDRVFFTGWRRDLPRVYADLDTLVVSSDNEGTPVAAIEAMAAGRPVVGTEVGGMPDLIDDGVTGFLVPPRDPEALATRLLELLDDPALAATMGERSARRVLERYRVERLVTDVERLYETLLQEKGVSEDS